MSTYNHTPIPSTKVNANASVFNAVFEELDAAIGNRNSLPTTDKDSPVGAIIELDARIDMLVLESGNSNLEVAEARGGETTLDARLDMMEAKMFNVLRYGAAGDGATDDSAAIAAAIAAAEAAASFTRSGATVWLPAGYEFYCASPVVVGKEVNFIMDSPINYGGSTWPALQIGTTSDSLVATYKRYRIWLERNTWSDWITDSGEAIIGVRFANVQSSEIDLFLVYRFTVGMLCYSNVQGFAYNTVRLGRLIDNKIGVDLDAQTAVGWCNENRFYGGSFNSASAIGQHTNKNAEIHAIRIGKTANYAHNNNRFHDPSFELGRDAIADASGAGTVVPIKILSGAMNTVSGARVENSDDTYIAEIVGAAASAAQSVFNRFEYTYKDTNQNLAINDGSGRNSAFGYSSNAVWHAGNAQLVPRAIPVFDSGAVATTVCHYNTSPVYHIPRLAGISSAGTPITTYVGALTIASNYLTLPGNHGAGVYVDTLRCKRFAVLVDIAAGGNAGNVGVLCFDSGGSVLYSATADTYYVEGETWNKLATPRTTFGAGGGGSYYFSDVLNTPTFKLHANVAKIFVFVADCRLCRFQIFALPAAAQGYPAAAWPGYEEIVPGCNLGTAAPTTGTWVAGRRVYKDAPAAGGVEGWICVTGGSPGTWKAFGTIAA